MPRVACRCASKAFSKHGLLQLLCYLTEVFLFQGSQHMSAHTTYLHTGQQPQMVSMRIV
jgi:hypothetical protein